MPAIDLITFIERVPREFAAAWAIARKDMLTYYIRPNIIVMGILFPLFMFLAFAIGNPAPPAALIPGLIAITILFSASSIEPVSIPIERRVKTFDRLISAPISMHSLVLGESMSGFLYSLGIAMFPLVIGILVFQTPIVSAAVLVLGLVLGAFCFATMGTLLASYPTENVGDVMSVLNLIRLPLIFISGVFIPIETMPKIGQVIAFFSPLTYANDLIRYGYGDSTHFGLLQDVVVLLIFILLFQFISHGLYKKFNE